MTTMTYDPNNHAAFRESIAAALAGGLSAAEETAFDAHRAACPECAAEFERAKESEARMTALFAPALPTVGFEARVIQRLRESAASSRRLRFARPSWRIHPALGKAVAGVAAAIVLAGVGYAVNGIVNPPDETKVAGKDSAYSYQSSYPATQGTGFGFKLNKTLGAEFAVSGDVNPKEEKVGRGQNLSYGDGHVRWERNPFTGVNRDNIAGEPHLRGATPAQTDGRYGITPSSEANKSGAGELHAGEGKSLQTETLSVAQAERKIEELSDTPSFNMQDASTPGYTNWFKPTELGLDDDARKRRTAGTVIEDIAGAPAQGAKPADAKPSPVPPANQPASGSGGGVGGVAGGDAAALRSGAYDANDSVLQPTDGTWDSPTGGVAKPAPPTTPPPAVALVPPPAPAGGSVQAAEPVQPVRQNEPTTRKVIRNGELAFEVDRFDSAFAQVSKLTAEAGGYVGTTSSEKLPNGKVQGKVTVRVPPDRLDTLVLQLRGIGDLRSQSLEAEDVSKKYTDLESQLRAARAMEERLIAIIKEGKGQIKDLLAAEKELGNWRTKAEELTGQMKYYDNLVSMATLRLTLTERNIETAATAHESETVDAGVESEDVEKAREAALKAIEEAKGRVVQSDLKRYDAGQFGATIVAEVPPDAAGPLLDRIKQIGKVARLDVQRKQTADGDASTATKAPVRVEKRDTRFNLSIYNLANVAPRQTATLNLAADDVEQAYQALLDRVAKAGGRIVTSNLNRQKPEQTTATIAFEVPTPQADAVTSDMRAAGESMKATVTENPDVQNVTTAKRGFNVTIIATAAVPPRETATIQIAATDVAQAREKILAVAGAQAAHVRAAQLNENDRQNVTASLELDVKRAALPAVEKALADAGQVIKRNVARSADAENTLDTKVRLSLTLLPADRLPPRETTTLTVESSDLETAMASLQSAALESGGRVSLSNLQKDRDGRGFGRVAVDVPLDKSGAIVRRARELGAVRAIDAGKDLQVPPGALARARIDVTFANADTLVAPERGLLASIRRGLSTSLSGLMWSLQLIIIGVCFVLPWALALYALWRFLKRRSGRTTPAPATPSVA